MTDLLPRDKALLTTEETARFTSLSESYVRDLAVKGKMPSIRIGTRLLIPVAALDVWINDELIDQGGGQWANEELAAMGRFTNGQTGSGAGASRSKNGVTPITAGRGRQSRPK